MMVWTCTQPVETCPCVCCQLERCKRERDEERRRAGLLLEERDQARAVVVWALSLADDYVKPHTTLFAWQGFETAVDALKQQHPWIREQPWLKESVSE